MNVKLKLEMGIIKKKIQEPNDFNHIFHMTVVEHLNFSANADTKQAFAKQGLLWMIILNNWVETVTYSPSQLSGSSLNYKKKLMSNVTQTLCLLLFTWGLLDHVSVISCYSYEDLYL